MLLNKHFPEGKCTSFGGSGQKIKKTLVSSPETASWQFGKANEGLWGITYDVLVGTEGV